MASVLEAPRSSDPLATSTLTPSERIRTALNFYDYAGQDPINQYDLSGETSAPPSIGLNWLNVEPGYNSISGWAYGTSSFLKPQPARIVVELFKGGIPIDIASGPVSSNGSIVPFEFGDLSPGEYTVKATFMQGKNVQEMEKTVEVSAPEEDKKPSTSVWSEPISLPPIPIPGGWLLE